MGGGIASTSLLFFLCLHTPPASLAWHACGACTAAQADGKGYYSSRPYECLGVAKDAAQSAIRKAYRKLRPVHPPHRSCSWQRAPALWITLCVAMWYGGGFASITRRPLIAAIEFRRGGRAKRVLL